MKSLLISKSQLILIIIAMLLPGISFSQSDDNDKMMIIIIDGARYRETFGDPDHTHIPKMWDIAQDGVFADEFYNDGTTYTSRAIPALWCGAWTEVRDTFYNGSNTSYAVKPTIFEYYQKQKDTEPEDCFYVLKYIPDLWLPSFDADYGPDYWPAFHSVGETDEDVAMETQFVMDTYHPRFLWVYLADVDHAGHSGIWDDYINAIENADNIVGLLWDKLQSDPFYENSTTLIVTNDHGRHDDQHGGFTGHGCSCDGCRHILFLAAGPEIKNNFISNQYRKIPDMAVTAAHILGLNPESATGDVMNEILTESSISDNNAPVIFNNVYPNPFSDITSINYSIDQSKKVRISIYDQYGKLINTILDEKQTPGNKSVIWNGENQFGIHMNKGIYFYRIMIEGWSWSGKIIYNK